jgi:AcrR family transcriptional regulator
MGVEGSSRAGVTEMQRARVLNAAARVTAELGYGGMSVARVASRAGISRRTFYDLFDGREDCFLALFDDALERATVVVREAVVAAGGNSWQERIRTGLAALLEFADEQPALGSLLVAGSLGGGPRVLERRAVVVNVLRGVIDEGRSHARAGHEPPPLTAEGTVGAILSVIHARLPEQPIQQRDTDRSATKPSRARNAPEPLIGLLNPLMGMIVLPYLGRAAAAKELARPVPCPSHTPKPSRTGAPPTPSGDPLEGLDMRLTYRTLRVLSAIADDPGTSNRQVAQTADVHDQGQISKLLSRLERLGLIHNTGHGQPKGEPNAWTLTTRGIEVESALRV